MKSIYQKFCREQLDSSGALAKIELDYPENFNFGYDVVDAIAESEPEKKALVWCNTENEEHIFTFSDIQKFSNQAANVLEASGITRGSRVMVILKRHYEYWFVTVALHKLGATMIPATHMLTVKDLEYRIRATHVDAVICTPQNEVPEKIQSALANLGVSARLWCVQSDRRGPSENLTEEMKAASDKLERRPTLVTDPMLLYFTSGTTGEPKGVIHDFSYPLAHIVTAKYWQQAEDGRTAFYCCRNRLGKGFMGQDLWAMACRMRGYGI